MDERRAKGKQVLKWCEPVTVSKRALNLWDWLGLYKRPVISVHFYFHCVEIFDTFAPLFGSKSLKVIIGFTVAINI